MKSVGIKIRCSNRYWAGAVQKMLHKQIGASWCATDQIPWSTFRLWLVVQWSSYAGRWCISWCPQREFDSVPLPEWDAKALIAATPTTKD